MANSCVLRIACCVLFFGMLATACNGPSAKKCQSCWSDFKNASAECCANNCYRDFVAQCSANDESKICSTSVITVCPTMCTTPKFTTESQEESSGSVNVECFESVLKSSHCKACYESANADAGGVLDSDCCKCLGSSIKCYPSAQHKKLCKDLSVVKCHPINPCEIPAVVGGTIGGFCGLVLIIAIAVFVTCKLRKYKARLNAVEAAQRAQVNVQQYPKPMSYPSS